MLYPFCVCSRRCILKLQIKCSLWADCVSLSESSECELFNYYYYYFPCFCISLVFSAQSECHKRVVATSAADTHLVLPFAATYSMLRICECLCIQWKCAEIFLRLCRVNVIIRLKWLRQTQELNLHFFFDSTMTISVNACSTCLVWNEAQRNHSFCGSSTLYSLLYTMRRRIESKLCVHNVMWQSSREKYGLKRGVACFTTRHNYYNHSLNVCLVWFGSMLDTRSPAMMWHFVSMRAWKETPNLWDRAFYMHRTTSY